MVQRATAQSKTGVRHGYGVAEASSLFNNFRRSELGVFQVGWSGSIYVFFSSFYPFQLLIWDNQVSFCT
jgi:hypothetical protein